MFAVTGGDDADDLDSGAGERSDSFCRSFELDDAPADGLTHFDQYRGRDPET